MTDTAMELVARLILDSDEYDAGLEIAIDDAEKKGNSIGSGLSKGFKVAGELIAGASTAVVGFGTAAVKTGEQFDSSMAQVAATMGKSVDEIQNLRDFAQEMGASTSFSASQAADALNYMALAGYDANQSMEMLPNVLNLAAAGGMSLATASDMVTDAQTALGIKFEDMGAVIDQMAKTASTTNTSVSQLGDAFLTIGATARNMKGGTVELSQVLGILADNGIKASEGGTHLRNMILSLQTPSDKGAIALEKIGMSYEKMYDEAGNMRALPEIFMEMQTAMEGMDQASKDAIISGVFNKTDLAAVNALIGTNAERWAQVEAAITDSAGAAQEMANTQLDNLAGDITLAKSAFEGLQIAISDELTPGIRDFVKFGGEGLQRLTMAFKEGGLGGAMEVFGDLLSQGLAMIIDKLPVVVDAGMQLIGALGQGLIDNLPVLTSAAVEIVTKLSQYVVEALPAIVQAGIDILVKLVEGITQALPTVITSLADVIARIAGILTDPNNIKSVINAGVELIKALVLGLIDAIPILIDAIPVIFENLSNAVIDSLPVLINGIVSLVTAIANKLPDIVKKIAQAIPKMLTSIIKALTSALPQLISGIVTLMNGLVQATPEIISTLIAAIPEIISGVVTAVVSALPVLIEGVTQLIIGLVGALPEEITMITEFVPQILEMIVNTLTENIPILIEGIVAMNMALFEHLPEIASVFIDLVPAIMKMMADQIIVNLPIVIRGLAKIWSSIITSVASGMQRVFESIGTEISGWWNQKQTDIKGGFDQFIEDFKKWLEDLPYNLGKKLGEMITKFVEWKDDALDWIKQDLPKIIDEIVKWFSELPGRVAEWFTNMINDLGFWASDMIDMVQEEVPKIIDEISKFFEELPEKALQWGADMIAEFGNGVTSKAGEALGAVTNFLDGVAENIHFSKPEKGPLADFDTYAPDMMDLFAQGVLDNEDKVVNAVKSAFDFGGVITSTTGNISSLTGASSGLITPNAGNNITVVLELDGEKFGKAVFNANLAESQRIGVDLGRTEVAYS